MPNLAFKYGTTEVAISFDSTNLRSMNEVFQEMRRDGWSLVLDRDPQYVKRVEPELIRRIVMERLTGQTVRTEHAALTKAAKKFLPFVGKKYPVFLVERRYIEPIKKIFKLSERDCIPLDDPNKIINVDEMTKNLVPYAAHIVVTDAYDELKKYIERCGLRENEDFFDGRGFLVLRD